MKLRGHASDISSMQFSPKNRDLFTIAHSDRTINAFRLAAPSSSLYGPLITVIIGWIRRTTRKRQLTPPPASLQAINYALSLLTVLTLLVLHMPETWQYSRSFLSFLLINGY
jgi:hypothetical protein